ncbi:MAG: undecaprenyl-phosphate glucose phosphotransferase [Anaerolineae bacterium]|nr:undecaprenyl-phosphate glucose phosphotransferase [Anaerolineae bacterium]
MFERYRRWVSLIMALTDVLLVNLAFAAAYWVRYDLQWFRAVDPANYAPFRMYIPFALVLTALLMIAYKLGGVYDQPRSASWLDEVYALFGGTTTGILIIMAITFWFRPLVYSRMMFIWAGLTIVTLLSLSRLIKRWVWESLMRQGLGVDRVLIVGAGEVGRRLMRNIVAQPELGYQVIGFVDDDPDKNKKDIGRFKALGGIDNLPRVVQEEAIDEVIVTLPWMHHRKILGIMRQCERERVRARIVPDLFQLALSRVDIEDLGGIPIIGVKEVSITGWNLAFKRASDIALSLAGLILLSPLLLLISVAIRLDSPGPILFKQDRVGKGRRRFVFYKFRSMRQGAEEERPQLAGRDEVVGPTFKIRHDPRCTRVGRFLRRTSLDELPQFYNVLRGEMSLVGPRPAIPSEVEQYQEWHRRRLEISPGITGLWQVSGRSQLTFDEMCLLDIYYLENWSPLLDLKIALKTIPAVLAGRGAY